MSSVPTRTRIEATSVSPKAIARFCGERDGWIYSDVPDAISQFNTLGRQLLFLHKESGEVYLFTLSTALVMEKNAVRVVARWLRLGDNEFSSPPPIDKTFDDVIATFLVHARLSSGWDPEREFTLGEY